MPRPVHFEIYAGDLERARRFYGELFGWGFQAWGEGSGGEGGGMPYWLINTGEEGPGIHGGLLQRPGRPELDREADAPILAWVCTVAVPDLDAYLEKAKALGALLDMDRTAVTGVGWLAYCKDTEGNLFGMIQMDPTAA